MAEEAPVTRAEFETWKKAHEEALLKLRDRVEAVEKKLEAAAVKVDQKMGVRLW